jgi:hypothetical protein
VKPPAAHRFDAAVLCTYSASLATLLSLPTALLVEAPEMLDEILSPANASKLLAAVQKTFRTMLVFCEESRIHGDQRLSPIVSYAEPVVREVRAPRGGAFHPKVWLLRFQPDDKRRPPILRVVILSRNLTKDPSWDVCVVLEGTPLGQKPAAFQALPKLLRALEKMCRTPLEAGRARLLHELTLMAEQTDWQAPNGLSDAIFHVTGITDGWVPPAYDRIAVFSPFLDVATLELLGQSTNKGSFLVSRKDMLDQVFDATHGNFRECYVLGTPSANDEDSAGPTGGLHAKIYVWDSNRRTRIAVGSANATLPGLDGRNVEFLADFDCTSSVRGGVRKLLDVTDLSKVLQRYEPEEMIKVDPASLHDSRPARRLLADAQLRLRCTETPDGIAIELVCAKPLDPAVASGLPGLRFWPATMPRERAARCGDALIRGEAVRFESLLRLSEVTRFTVFEADTPAGTEMFTLILDLEGIDEKARRAAIAEDLLLTPEGFLDFVRMLLGDLRAIATDPTEGDEGASIARIRPAAQRLPAVLEALVKCAADEPERLDYVRAALDDISQDLTGIVPIEFRNLWSELQLAGEQRPIRKSSSTIRAKSAK